MLGTIVYYSLGGVLFLIAAVWIAGERGLLVRKSTREMMKGESWKHMLHPASIHSYVYGRWTKETLWALRKAGPILNAPAKEWIANNYQGQVVTYDNASKIVTLNKNIPLRDLEQVVPNSAAHDLVMASSADNMIVLECPCRNSLGKKHCEPSQVCIIIGKHFTQFLLEHNPKITRRITQAEALDILKMSRDRGYINSVWFKDLFHKDIHLSRSFGVCNCCRCCCGGIWAMNNHDISMLTPSGYVAAVDTAKCDGCGTCEKACHFNAVSIGKHATVNLEKCMGCGVCEAKCPNEAMSLLLEKKKGMPFDVQKMVNI